MTQMNIVYFIQLTNFYYIYNNKEGDRCIEYM